MSRRGENIHKRKDGRWEGRYIKNYDINGKMILEHYIFNNMNEKNIGILLSLYAGLRIGEVCALKWSDINFGEKTIHIKDTVSRIAIVTEELAQAKTKLQINDAKTYSSNRTIPIPEILYKLLFQFRNNDSAFILKGSSYPYVDPRTLQYAFHKTLKECGLRDINYHTLRHTFATRCIESGIIVCLLILLNEFNYVAFQSILFIL